MKRFLTSFTYLTLVSTQDVKFTPGEHPCVGPDGKQEGYKEGKDYIFQKDAKTIEACQQSCGKIAECKAFSFEADGEPGQKCMEYKFAGVKASEKAIEGDKSKCFVKDGAADAMLDDGEDEYTQEYKTTEGRCLKIFTDDE